MTYLSQKNNNSVVKPHSIRTSIDLPPDLHRRLHEAAVGIEHAVQHSEPVRSRQRLSLDPPLIASAGRHIDLANERIYDLIEFP